MSKKHRKLLSVTAEILENVYVRMYSCFLVKKIWITVAFL